jgi:hypothetical protein
MPKAGNGPLCDPKPAFVRPMTQLSPIRPGSERHGVLIARQTPGSSTPAIRRSRPSSRGARGAPSLTSGLKQIRWRVTLRGELLGHVYADNFTAACERAVKRWKISSEDQEELRVEKAE